MTKTIFALAALAAIGFVGAAYAKDAKPTAAAPTVMSDSEMDKVTAGEFDLGVHPPCTAAGDNCRQGAIRKIPGNVPFEIHNKGVTICLNGPGC